MCVSIFPYVYIRLPIWPSAIIRRALCHPPCAKTSPAELAELSLVEPLPPDLSFYLSIFIHIYICLSFHPSIYVSIYLSIYLYLCIYIYIYIYILYICVCMYVYIYMFV